MSRAAEGAFLAAISAGPLLFGSVERWSLCVVGLLVFTAAALILTQHPVQATSPALWAAIAIGALSLTQAARASQWGGPSAWGPSALHGQASWQAPARIAMLIASLWAAQALSSGRSFRVRLLSAVFATAILVAIVGLVQMRYGNDALYGLRSVRIGHPFGPYYNSGNAAAFLSMGGFCGLGLLLARSAPRERGAGATADYWAGQALILFGILIIGTAVAVTRSRSAALAGVAGLALLAALSCHRGMSRGRAAFAALSAAGVGILFAATAWRDPRWLGYYQFIGDKFDTSTSYRLSMWKSGLTLAADYPLWGVGWGSTKFLFPVYQERVVAGYVEYLHSDWLECLTSFGVAGFGAVAVGLAGQFARGLDRARQEPDAAAVLAGLAAFLLHSALDFPFEIMGTAVVFCALLGWLVARPERPLAAWAARAGLVGIVLAGAALLVPPGRPSPTDCGPDRACLLREAGDLDAAGRAADAAMRRARAEQVRMF